jgi:hypothetical protein
MPDINIGSKLDAKGFKQAETALDKLGNNAKSLAKTLGVTFGGAAVLAYAKKSIKAAAEDQAAQASLAQTLKNLGYENKAVADSVNGFISNLERQTGILDDELRPAMDRLLRATGSVTKSQELMGLALDISAGTGKDLGQVTQSLQKAFLGQTQALGRLGVGLSKAELSSSNFEEITSRLSVLFAGQAQRQADSFKGSIDKLGVAANNVSEIIGTGLIDALKSLGDDGSVDELTKGMEDFALFTADAIRGVGVLLEALKAIPAAVNLPGLKFAMQATGLGILSKIGASERKKQEAAAARATNGLAHLAELQSKYATTTLSTKKKITTEELKSLKAKQLAAAIDKANRALGKGTGVFDLDKIQLAAAEKAAAEQLGKVTSEAQLLSITNDLARLQVKEDMLALEDAIASKDVAAIAAATAKLNGDLLILGALTNQEVKLLDIEEILAALLPKELIDLANLDEAIAKLLELSKIVINPIVPVAPVPPRDPRDETATTPEQIADLIKDRGNEAISGPSDPRVEYGGQRPNLGGGYEAFDPERGGLTSGGSRPNQSNNTTTVTITVNESLDPNLTATRIQKILTDSANNTGNVYDLGTGSKNTSYVV